MEAIEELIETIDNDNIPKLKAIAKSGFDFSQTITVGLEYEIEDPDEISILFYAIRNYASIEFIEVLLENGSNINYVDDDGLSTIDIAIKFKRTDVIQLCIDKGIDINATTRTSGMTPIVVASCFNNIEIVQLLIDNGAEVNAQDKIGMSCKDYAKKLGQKKMLAFLHEKGAKYNRYVADAQREAQEEQTAKQGDMNNRPTPTDDMGFDSI